MIFIRLFQVSCSMIEINFVFASGLCYIYLWDVLNGMVISVVQNLFRFVIKMFAFYRNIESEVYPVCKCSLPLTGNMSANQ